MARLCRTVKIKNAAVEMRFGADSQRRFSIHCSLFHEKSIFANFNIHSMRKLFLLAIYLFYSCQTLLCQERDYHLDKDNMSFFKEAELVVEGRFLKPLHAYAVKDANGKEHYYGICPVIAYRVFKGNAKSGDTIYVTREGESLGGAIASPYDDTRGYVNEAGIHIIEDVLYVAPVIARSKNVHHILDHFRTDCVVFFKTSTYPKTNGTRYDTLTQYQYLYPFVFYISSSVQCTVISFIHFL